MNEGRNKKRILALVSAVLVSFFVLLPVGQFAQASSEEIDVSIGFNQQEIDNEFVPAIAPWDWQMLEADYHLRVKEDFTAGQIIEFELNNSTIQLQPMGLEWSNNLSQIQSISIPQDVPPVVTNPEVSLSGFIKHQGTITWNDAYGSNIDFEWKSTPSILNKTLTISSLSDLPIPQEYIVDGGNPFLRLNLIFDPSTDLDIYVDNEVWDKKTKVQTFNNIEFRKDGQVLWTFMPLMYWDSAGNEGQSIATLEASGNKLYISVRVPYSWLQDANYPVYVDADIQIEAAASTNLYNRALRGGVFWTSTTVGYVIYNNAKADLVYNKTADGGATWAGAVAIVAAASCDAVKYDCWADWQTDGDAGTKIHIAYMSYDTEEVRYVYLDTSDDSVGGDDLIETCQGTGTLRANLTLAVHMVSITKTRGGNFAVAIKYQDDASTPFSSFYTSPDADTWTSKTSPYEASGDRCLLFPANLADNQDVWGVYRDALADEISLKTFDDSNNDWTTIGEASISAGMTESGFYQQMDGAIRLSDGHLILAAWNWYDYAAADLMVWDITDAGTITAKTNVITDESESFLVSVFVNQENDDIYIAYVSGTAANALVATFYQKSTDGGGTWDGEAAMQADAEDDEKWISCGAVKAAWGGKFQPVWFNDDLNDLFTNTDNGISIPAAGACSPNIDNSPVSKEYGIVAENNIYETGLTNFTVTNNSGGAITITIQATDFTGGNGWTLSDTATPGVDIAGLKAGVEGGDYTIVVKKTGPYNILVTGLADEATQKWGLKLYTPTSHSDGVEKSSIVTLTATCD